MRGGWGAYGPRPFLQVSFTNNLKTFIPPDGRYPPPPIHLIHQAAPGNFLGEAGLEVHPTGYNEAGEKSRQPQGWGPGMGMLTSQEQGQNAQAAQESQGNGNRTRRISGVACIFERMTSR